MMGQRTKKKHGCCLEQKETRKSRSFLEMYNYYTVDIPSCYIICGSGHSFPDYDNVLYMFN